MRGWRPCWRIRPYAIAARPVFRDNSVKSRIDHATSILGSTTPRSARTVSTTAKVHDDSTAVASPSYFSQNRDLLNEDIEDSWRRAQLSAEQGSLPPEEQSQVVRQALRSQQQHLRSANAALSFDDDAGSLPSGMGHRDIIMRTTTLDNQGEMIKRSETVAKSQLCTNHGLQVCYFSPPYRIFS